MERLTFILYTDAHVCVYNPVLPWRRRLSQHVGQPLHLTSCLLCCLCIYFSPQLNSLNLMPPLHPSPPCSTVIQPYIYPLPMKAGKYRWASTRDMRGNRNRQNKKWSSKWPLTFFSSPFLLGSLPASLPAWLVKVSAARQAGLFWQPSSSWLSCPRKRKERRRGGQI